jgi:hypothetical protein
LTKAAPKVFVRVAQEAGVGRPIISHIGPFPLVRVSRDLDPVIAELKKNYSGALVGADLQCNQVE